MGKGKDGNPISPKRKRGRVVLTKVGHAAEQPPPRKETGQITKTVTVVVVGRLGLHVYVYRECEAIYHVALTHTGTA